MTAREKVWLAVAVTLVLLITSGPYVAGWLSAPNGQTFTGILIERQDGYSYLAKMRLGSGGSWLFQDMYATQPHPATPLFSVFLLLGHLATPAVDARVPLTTLSLAYAASRVVFGALFLVMLYVFIASFVEPIGQRRLAWLLIAVGGGLGWLLLIVTGQALPFGAPPLDLYMGEANTVVPLLAYPHTLLARAALLAGALCLARADDRGDFRWAAAAGGCWLVATLGVPFEVLIAGGMVGGWIAARWLRTRQIPWRLVWMGLLAGFPGALFNSITLLMIGQDPVYAAWTGQNLLPLPPAVHLLSAFGIQAVLAVLGAIVVWRSGSPRADLLIGWVIVAPLLTLIPLPFQLRFIEGFTVPLGILAIAGLNWVASGRAYRALAAGLFVLILPTSLLLVGGGTASALGGFGRWTQDQAAMFEWLRTQGKPGEVVLSSDETGVMIPAAAPLRSALGHGFETPDFKTVRAFVTSVYDGNVSPADAAAWMGAHHIRYVIVGPDEAALANEPLAEVAASTAREIPLREVFAQGSYHIYEIETP